MHNFGFGELLLIFGLAILLFGNRLPSVGKSLGEGLRNFKKGLSDDDSETSNSKEKSFSQKSTVSAQPQNPQQISQQQPSKVHGVVDVDVHEHKS